MEKMSLKIILSNLQPLTSYGNVYLFDASSVILTFDFNDIRAVENKVKEIYKDILNVESIKPLTISMGIIRYPINTKEKT